jgi:hypothetical protein
LEFRQVEFGPIGNVAVVLKQRKYDREARRLVSQDRATTEQLQHSALWDLGITELVGHNIEAQGREEVNRLLTEGWVLLHIYTLQYNDSGIWRQRPMAILGRRKPARASNSSRRRKRENGTGS